MSGVPQGPHDCLVVAPFQAVEEIVWSKEFREITHPATAI
jgi:hypothetical protein